MTRHHYVPQFCIKKWLNQNGSIFCYYLNDACEIKCFKKKSTNDLAQCQNLYGSLGTKHYAELDSKGAGCFDFFIKQKIEDYLCIDDVLPKKMRVNFSDFLTSLTGRDPAAIKLAQSKLRSIINILQPENSS
jgi:hypothetical protein